MRVIYVDESGHSNNEKIAMVAGVILDPDRKWRLLDGAIQALKAEVPEQYRDNFVFHATDLEGGGRYRAEWPDEERWALLNKLLELPRQHQVPIVFGFFEKPDVVQTIRGHARSLVVHALSFAMCLKAVDSYMENEASGELAMLVAEQREEARRAIEETQRMMQHRQAKDFLPALLTKPISHIKSTPSFATKQDEPLLQLADACAFALHRYLRRAPRSESRMAAMCGPSAPLTEFEQFFDESAGFGGCLVWSEQSYRSVLTTTYKAT